MTLSERYKNRKTLKEQGEPAQNQNKPPEEKIEELRGQLKKSGGAIKIPSLKNAFAEALKKIAKLEAKDEIDLSAEWESLKPKIDAAVEQAQIWDAGPDSYLENLKNFSNHFNSIEKLIEEFKDKDKLSNFFKDLKSTHARFDKFVDKGTSADKTDAAWIKFNKTSKDLVQGIESFMEKFEAQAKLDPAKIIKEVEALIEQTKTSMKALGKFLEDGNYVTNENKERTLGEILTPTKTTGSDASAPTVPAPAAAPAAT